MRKISKILTIFCLLCANIYAVDLYKSSQKISLRAPAVPLITSDPYLSIWSPYNTLTEGNTEHWTGVAHPLIGAVRVDGKTYRFLGKDKLNLTSILPMTYGSAWEAVYTFDKPKDSWTDLNFDDSGWKKGKAAFGTKEQPRIETLWQTKDIYIRRTFDLSEDLTKEEIILKYSHDDIFELYLNGEKLVSTDYSWKNDVMLTLTDKAKQKLKTGKNIIAAHCHNRTGGAYVDFGLFKKDKHFSGFETEAVQKSVAVMPTQTYYTFVCGQVELDLVFTAPFLMTDLDLLSTPINYISYRVKSLDKKQHSVQIYFETTPELAVNDVTQPVTSERIEKNGMVYLKTGTIDQPITKRIGDDVRIDWGYAYLTSDNSKNKNLALGDYFPMKESFMKNGQLTPNSPTNLVTLKLDDKMPVLAYCDDLGNVDLNGQSGYLMLGYDDIYSVEYFYQRRLAYWKHDGKVDIFQAFEKMKNGYESVLQRCYDFDVQLYNDARQAGGLEYAELCALTYRQAIAAHKLITDERGNLLFFSKENNSNGCINTVDITYPSAPLFLLYNPDLLKGMMTSIFYYSESGRWQKPFPAHDLGTYPIADGQLYGGDMPVEEGGNMVILTTAISLVEGNANYARQHWETLTIWANYLAEKGLDPENQLCTDDFAGHLAHNANLSIKAIMAIAGYGVMAEMLGKKETAAEYLQIARTMAALWETMARDGDHYKLAFDKSGTWSQKYNLVWDKIFKLNIFPSSVIDTELPFYLKKQKEHKYGLPLDSRETYTKTDWILWTACMATNSDDFNQIVSLVYKYANETTSRVAISDWHDTDSGKMINFKARSVVGGYYLKMLDYKINKK